MSSEFFLKSVFVFALITPIFSTQFCTAADDSSELQQQFNKEIRPILENACGDCHWDATAQAGFNIEPFQNIKQFLESSKKWRKAIQRIEANEMPPDDAEPLSGSARQKLLGWLDRLYNHLDCSNILPGNVTIRRLNRTEYRNTIRDLTGVDYLQADSFPGDDIGYNFDNIADTLSLPPVLMEKYLDAAEAIVGQTIVDPKHPALQIDLAGIAFESTNHTSVKRNGTIVLVTRDTVLTEIEFPGPGTYQLQVTAFGDQAGDQWVQMAVEVGGQTIGQCEVQSSRSNDPSTHEFTLVIFDRGQHRIGIRFENDFYRPRGEGNQDRNLHLVGISISGPQATKNLLDTFAFVPGDSRESQDAAAKEFFQEFTSRAFRRQPDETEQSKWLGLYVQARDRGDTFYEALSLTAQAILVSPHFLYKVESPVGAGQQRRLNDDELATSLSYFLWSTMPDDELFHAAREHQLSDPVAYRQQVQRMLQSPKADALVDNFATQWLQLRSLASAQPDPELFPGIDAQMLSDMVTETKLLFADVLHRDADIFELLSSEHTFVNQRLANHYGLDFASSDPREDAFKRVDLQSVNRGGLLTQASILTLTSNPSRTSPVKRGKWILENLLGEEPPPPLPGIVPLDDQKELTGTLRQKMEQHRTNPECASCHQVMDPLGFALENYDAVGRWRLTDDGQEIDATGQLPDGTKFSGAFELQKALETELRDKFLRCFAEKMLIYALGRGLQYYDECAVDAIMEKAQKSKNRISGIVFAVVESEPFLQRRGEPKGESR
jgi:hypothetical protein